MKTVIKSNHQYRSLMTSFRLIEINQNMSNKHKRTSNTDKRGKLVNLFWKKTGVETVKTKHFKFKFFVTCAFPKKDDIWQINNSGWQSFFKTIFLKNYSEVMKIYRSKLKYLKLFICFPINFKRSGHGFSIGRVKSIHKINRDHY